MVERKGIFVDCIFQMLKKKTYLTIYYKVTLWEIVSIFKYIFYPIFLDLKYQVSM